MLGNNEKGTINYTCTTQAFPEFPNLLFGPQIDDSASYFDATFYLLQQHPAQRTVNGFFISYKQQIDDLAKAYSIDHDSISKTNGAGHVLIHSNFVYLFISFVDPDFLAYMCDRTHELMVSGMAVSDSYLLMAAKSRLSPEIINTILKDDEPAE